MKFLPLQHRIFVEASQTEIRILNGNDGAEFSLDRLESGQLTPACREKIVAALRRMLNRRTLHIGPQIWCAISARGVSLRRFTLPRAPDDELSRVLALQVETEFPLPPDELAWGFYRLLENGPGSHGAGQQVMVAAVKADALQEYAQLFSSCRFDSAFTLAALARCAACPTAPDSYYLLEIGRHGSELSTVKGGMLVNVRVIPWGEANIATAIQKHLNTSLEEAESILLSTPAAAHQTRASEIEASFNATATGLVALLPGEIAAQRLYLSGRISQSAFLGQALRIVLGSGAQLEPVDVSTGPGRSAATVGLETLGTGARATLPLVLRAKQDGIQARGAAPSAWRWAAAAALVFLALLSLRYGEALLCKRSLATRLAEARQYRQGLPQIDRELALFQYLETNGPPMLDTLYLLADTAPRGVRFDSVAMSRRGDVSLRGMFGNSQQGTDFRAKLIGTEFFSSVVFDEQTPTPDRQRVTFRLSAQWKPTGRPTVSPETGNEKSPPAAKGPETSKPITGPGPATAMSSSHARPH